MFDYRARPDGEREGAQTDSGEKRRRRNRGDSRREKQQAEGFEETDAEDKLQRDGEDRRGGWTRD